MCALRLSHSGDLRTQWVDMSRVTKTANYILDIDHHVTVSTYTGLNLQEYCIET